MDLCEIGAAMGEFDYIIAHGVYSWVPDPIRDGLLAVCRERLAPEGVAYISYNALPGRYVRTMMREMMIYHTRNLKDPGSAWSRRVHCSASWARRISCRPPGSRWSKRKSSWRSPKTPGGSFTTTWTVNDPFYVRDFVARAGEAFAAISGRRPAASDVRFRTPLDLVGGDVLEREQYFDFLCLRPFRQTLLCGNEAGSARPAGPEQMDRFLFSSPAREAKGQIEGLHSVCLRRRPSRYARSRALGAIYPLPVAFDELLALAGDREGLRGILFALISSGFWLSIPTHAGEQSNPGPSADRLARWESYHTGVVTYSDTYRQ